MNKTHFVGAALCALAGAANAQSSATVFGAVDINLRYQDNDGSPTKRVMGTDGLNSSRLGFRAVEDLGDGLKAGFWLEGAMTPNDGNSAGLAIGAGGVVIGLLIMVGLPIMYGIMGFVGGAIAALLYNLFSNWVGGIEIEVESIY